MANYYPLANQNEWTYKLKDGTTYSNKVVEAAGDNFHMFNSAANMSSIVRKEGDWFTTDAFEKENFQKWLKNDLKAGDSWEVNFKANGLDCILIMTVKENGINKEVENNDYENVLFIESENRIKMNGNIMPLNFFTQYYYADGVGLILTTSSAGDYHGLTKYNLNW